MKKLVIGILAHVDAGKTTLSEGMLYVSGYLRNLGRVDYGDAFLDTYEMERARGITIFSKQAVFSLGETEITLLDTPGHVDFSAEMERTLQILDYGILVISGADGIQAHTLTLWKLLNRYQIPVFLFINKMDQEGTDQKQLLSELQSRLDERCVDFSVCGWKEEGEEPSEGAWNEFYENLAMCDEELLEQYLDKGTIEEEEIQKLVERRQVFPCYFGSALKLEGVQGFLKGLSNYTKKQTYPQVFGAKVFKISRDPQGNRLTHMKLTGGSLKVKDSITEGEKINQIRIYSGAKFEATSKITAGSVCAVTGLAKTYAGQGLGKELAADLPVLEPVLLFQVIVPEGCDIHQMLGNLRQLEEEEPLLHILWDEQLNEIYVQLMGEVQIQVLKSLIEERFGIKVEFGSGHIVYKETILEPVEGIGHFEPLRHYAEVHLLLEPGERGSGLQFLASCSEDVLERNWQRLVLTHLEEREHKGVLTGSPITDIKITVIAGKAHQKHTEGGDFRQATYRAVRQGLMKAKSILLEPYYQFRLEIPEEFVGRAMSDIQKMSGTFEAPRLEGAQAILTGSAPVEEMRGYQSQVSAYSKGLGKLICTMKGYEPCHKEAQVLEDSGYDPELDLEHTPDSVFCSHGAGFIVPWYQVEQYMHIESGFGREESREEPEKDYQWDGGGKTAFGEYSSGGYSGSLELDKELEEIFSRTYKGSKKQRDLLEKRTLGGRLSGQMNLKERTWQSKEPLEEYLLVDGYNIIFSWEELKELAKTNLDGARQRLMDILCNYQGFQNCHLILVFDAYRVQGHRCEVQAYHNIHIVYTKEAETADQYIEKVVHELGKKYRVRVATSDGLEQVIILGQGGLRMSASELKEEVERVNQAIREEYLEKPHKKQNLLFQEVDSETAVFLEEIGKIDETAKTKAKQTIKAKDRREK